MSGDFNEAILCQTESIICYRDIYMRACADHPSFLGRGSSSSSYLLPSFELSD